jgi:predicted phage tail protein
VAGTDVTFKNIYLDNTPIQNSDGSYNFTGIRVAALPGTHNQDYLAGFDSTDKIVAVGTEVKAATPITRTITDPLVDSVRVTLALGSLVTMTDKGDRVGGSVSLTVMCGGKSYPVTISGKTTSAYHQDVMLTDLPDVPFNISVQRNTPDSTTDKVSNETHWVSYVESIDAKFSYPNSVVVGLEIDSAQFGGKIPTRTYRNKWTQIKVPSNYDPITRTYEGVWLGEFKTAWSDNPAWVFYDLVTDKRYGLGDRLGEFGCDKWSLYQIAKYCDQIVPDGFGGEEPRFTCNAYLSEPRDAKALLDDLASVFRGIAVWDGQMVTALQDAKKDPTATYSNANVVDGMFAYSGAAQKTIFTAVHVKYNDKTDNFATKTEYVANDEAIKRYGLNVKQITAFGCTSRGQAARVGKGMIETSIRERQMVSFSVGREGIRHLPFDIIEIADNDYAGDMIGGRVLSVSGNIITVDRAMSDISSIRYYANGQSKTINVTATNDNTITLVDSPVGIEQLGVFSATKTDVKPRLFRALSIAEDDGTYTISAVQHDENKEAVVDRGVTFEQDDTATKHKPQVSYGTVSKDGDELVVSWEGTNTTQYFIKIYKDGELYNSYTQDTAEIKLKGLSNGDYRAEIRGKSANGELTEAVIKEWSIDYDINGLKATPELFAIKLDWTNPATVINKAKIEIYRSQTADIATASKVATLSYPTDTFTQNGVKLLETHHFWLRLVDDQGNTGNWVTISGQCSSDTSQIVASINGQITQTELAQSLIDSLQNDIDTAKNQAVSTANIDAVNKVAAEATARANALQAEATARANAVQAEANARTQAIAAQDTKQTNALIAKAQELGTQITEVSGVNDQQAQQLTTITAKQGELTSGLEIERTARIAGDTAEATARQTLASQVGGNKTSITDLQFTKASKTEVSSLARTALQSEWKNYADDKVNNLEIGARNLLVIKDLTFNSYVVPETGAIEPTNAHANSAYIKVESNARYTLSTGVLGFYNLRIAHYTVDKAYISGSFDSGYLLKPKIITTPDNAAYLVMSAEHKNRGNYQNWKIERGTKATDWTPAPEDVTASIDVVSSDLTEFKETTASKDSAQTIVNTQALSRINNAESSITSLQSTKASKTEVSSLARTALQSEWQDAATTAKTQAITAAATDAKAKADAALASAKTDAQTKADAAKAAAQTYATQKVAAKSVTDKAYADGLVTAEEQRAINDANAKLTAAKADAKNKADAAETAAKAHAELQVESLEIGGRNLLKYSDWSNGFVDVYPHSESTVSDAGYLITNMMVSESNQKTAFRIRDGENTSIIKGQTYTLSIYIRASAPLELSYTAIMYNTNGMTNRLLDVTDTVVNSLTDDFQIIKVVFKSDYTVDNADIMIGTKTFLPLNFKIHTKYLKLEKGNKATDWTPAPEDVDAAIDVVSSELTSFKETTASKDSAQTIVNNQALSRINNAESSITSLQSTKASKTEVSSLARTALQSEWQDAATTAKSQAISAATADAKAKADAALASAKTDAQTKADAAKAAAQTYATQKVAAKSVTDKAYADGLVTAEEQRAINDANAKLTAAKADAKNKADAAETAAKAHAELQVESLEIGGRNLLKYSDWSNGFVDVYPHSESTVSDAGYLITNMMVSESNQKTAFRIRDGENTSIIKGQTYTLSIYIRASAPLELSYTAIMYNTNGMTNRLLDVTDTVVNSLTDDFQIIKVVFKSDYTVDNADIMIGTKTFLPLNFKIHTKYLKLEKGNKATDWTPAPEDVDAAIDVVSSELTSFKETTASKDSAQTIVNNQALSRINNAESSITSLQSTKASKTEVSSLARTALQSEWQDAATTAKSQAISAAKADAKNKADAAETAAKAHAELQVESLEIGGRNLLIIKDLTFNSYVIPETGAIEPTNAHANSTHIKVESNARYTLSTFGSAFFNLRIAYYTADKVYISGEFKSGYLDKPRTITTPANAVYMVMSAEYSGRGNYQNWKVEKGTKATDWTPAPEDVAASIDIVSSDLTEFKETTASKDSAQTIVNNQALSRINTAEGKITTLQSTSVTKDTAQSTHTIKTQAIAGGKRALAGIAVGAMANETTAESQVIVMADKFGVVKDAGDSTVKPMLTVVNDQVAVNGDLIADGTILGKHLKANQTITAPFINGGELNINNRFKVDRFGNTTIQSSAGNVGLKITDEKIEVYDDSGQIRVRLGVW